MWVFVRSMWPIAPVLVLTMVFTALFARLGAADVARYIYIAGAAVVVAWSVAVTIRRWRHDSGRDDACQRCGGPLGFLLPGRRRYGRQLSDFRRCWQCGKPQAEPES